MIVNDDIHENNREGAQVWDGDALQIGICGYGNGAGDRPAETRMVGADDASITVALTDKGPRIWAHLQGKYGNGYLEKGARDYPCSITRNEQQKTTAYRISFPFSDGRWRNMAERDP